MIRGRKGGVQYIVNQRDTLDVHVFPIESILEEFHYVIADRVFR